MDRSPRNDHYFKQSTRRILDDEAKKAHLDAVQRATRGLLSGSLIRESGRARPLSLAEIRVEIKRFDRLIMLNKGAIQPRHLYRREREMEIHRAALEISQETGESYHRVFRLLEFRMRDYL